MTASRVDRLHVRCCAARDQEAAALALRRRLDGMARTHLPEALARVLADDRSRTFVDRLAVRLDFTPDDYDDVTIAALWAERIRHALDALPSDAGVHRFETEAAFVIAAVRELAATGALSWIFTELVPAPAQASVANVLTACAQPSRLPALAHALAAEPMLAYALFNRLTVPDRERLARSVAHLLPGPDVADPSPTGAPPSHADTRPPEAATAGAPPDDAPPASARSPDAGATFSRRESPRQWWSRRLARGGAISTDEWQALWSAAAGKETEPKVAARAAAPRAGELPIRERAIDEGAERGARVHDPDAPRTSITPAAPRVGAPGVRVAEATLSEVGAWQTTAGGVAFLYPWLAPFLETAPGVVDHPAALSAETARRLHALHVLAGPARVQHSAEDPLLLFLAGEHPSVSCTGAGAMRSREDDGLMVAAADLLRTFAESLVGFETADIEFLQRHFVLRPGRLEVAGERAFRLRLDRAPLDVVVGRLRYPLGPFRLPWTPVLEVVLSPDA